MATVAKIGPTDHGRPMTWDDYQRGEYEEGYKYELIEGRLYVSPLPNMGSESIEDWIAGKLRDYVKSHPEIVNRISEKARVFVPEPAEVTAPEPDVAVYSNYPSHLPRRLRNWQDYTPVLVVEVVSPGDPDKDYVRNVELYRLVPGIREYWVLDPGDDPDRPTLRVYCRHGRGWRAPLDLAFGSVYTTRLLPGFTLTIDPNT
jgi:Uma2 family endonuclease